jgi:hypothetical protein
MTGADKSKLEGIATGATNFNPASPGPIGATTPNTGKFTSVDLSQGITGTVLVDSSTFQGLRGAVGRGALLDRFANANVRFGVTVTGPAISPNAIFDASSDSFSTYPANTTTTYEIDYANESPWTPNVSSGMLYGGGLIYVDNYFGAYPQSVTVEYYRWSGGVDSWVVVGQAVASDFSNTRPTFFVGGTSESYVKKVRITVVSPAGSLSRLSGIRYIPLRPWPTERPHFLASSAETPVNLLAPALEVQQGSEVGALKPNAVEIRSTTGSTRWRIQVNDSGVITTTSI